MKNQRLFSELKWDGTSPTEGDRGTGAVDRRADPQEAEEGRGYDQPRVADSRGVSVQATGRLQRQTRESGIASLESYLAQLELAAQLGGWTPEQTAGHLALALEGPALEAILDLPPAERQDLQALTAALQRRFIQHRSAEASREKLLSRYRCEEENRKKSGGRRTELRPRGLPGVQCSSAGEASTACISASPHARAAT
ncbi:hypothetical protein SKAU_G00062650 [Synaphobranchus kaupii]|uniref:Uncharacterized protein n=1 Tax=Synaphobranchus kaupii TaxID=118154 RepID=A0A9Q1G5B9_SYNKA|nr:hypothetical protein SKAU_G00062650 [Synaphobranchus kaupii]